MSNEPKPVAFSVSFRFRAVRERRNLSQQELADKTGVSRNTVSNLENTSDVKLSTLLALSAALDVPVHTWLMPDRKWSDWFCDSYPQEITTLSWQRLRDLPPGFVFVTQDGVLAVKSEYRHNDQCQCILLGSGEYAYFQQGDNIMVSAIEVMIP